MNKRTLVLPEVYTNINIWWALSVVKKMYELDNNNFEYIIKNWTYTYWKDSIQWLWNIWDTLIVKIARYFVKNISSVPLFFYTIYVLVFKFFTIRKIKINNYNHVISHDIFISLIIIIFYKWIKVTNIYHGQGSLYYEHTKLLWYKQSFLLKKLLNLIEYVVYNNCYLIWFPSNWACEALLNTNTNLIKIIDKRKKDIKILYNSIDTNLLPVVNVEIEKNIIKDWYNFVSIWAVNDAKWIDKIPQFLSNLKNNWIKFKWILIWRPGDKKNDLENNIINTGIQDYVYWYDKWLNKSEIYSLLSKTDFYIMFHRYSIFDLATLESMFFWNIPILSNIWGNKEVIVDNNWLLIDENNISNIDWFINFIKKNDIKKLKEINKHVIINHFSNENFIKNYLNL